MSKRLEIALAVSLLLHALALVGVGVMKRWHFFEVLPPEVAAAVARQDESPLQFELVESPENVPSEQPEKTHLVSDKSQRAHNPEAPSDLPLGESYSQGLTPLRELPQDGVQANAATAGSPASQDAPQPAKSSPRLAELGSREQPLRPAREFTRETLTGQPQPPVVQRRSSTARYNQEASRAPEIGGFSFNTYAWDFAPYLLALRRKIQRNIFPPPAFTKMGIISGETIVRFRIYPDGRLEGLQVLDYSGHRSLMVTSVNAVKYAAPFLPLPDDFPEKYLEVTGKFSYVVVR